MTSHLTFRDIVVLKVMRDFMIAHDLPLPRLSLWTKNGSVVNDWYDMNKIPNGKAYGFRLTSAGTASRIIKRLREYGLIRLEKPNYKKGKHVTTEFGQEFLKKLPQDWQQWPLKIEFVDGAFDFANAYYISKPKRGFRFWKKNKD